MSTELRLQIRPAREGDARGLAQLWAEAFPGEPRPEIRLRALLDRSGPYGGLETCWLAEEEGILVGAFRQYPLRMYLRGRPFPVQGLAAVAVPLRERRRGIGRAMCEQALRLGPDGGYLLSALFPFRVDFYSRIGYALAGELHRYRFPPTSLPPFPGHERVRRIEAGSAGDLLPSFYRSMLSRSHGLVDRTPPMWRSRLDGTVQVYGFFERAAVGRSEELKGYMILEPSRTRAPERSTLRVQELLAAELEAYQGLLGWLSLRGDEWAYIRHDALPGEAFHRVLSDPRIPDSPAARGLWFPSATLLRGPMLRILDVAGVLEASGLEPGVPLPVKDREVPENEGTWARAPDGSWRRAAGGLPEDGSALSIGLMTELFVSGRLPGQTAARGCPGPPPAPALEDFRLYDVF